MTAQEMLQILKGDADGKRRLFQDLTSKLSEGEALEDDEISIFEALKKDLIKPEKQVVEMSASITAVSGMSVG